MSLLIERTSNNSKRLILSPEKYAPAFTCYDTDGNKVMLKDFREKFIKVNKSESINLFAGEGWRSEAVKSYQITGVPTFVLIDREGKIIDAQAQRPSSSDIRKVLDALPAQN